MAELTFAAIGDPHLDGMKHLQLDDTFIYEQIARVLKQCAKKGIKHIILLGDIFDVKTPSQKSMVGFVNFLASYPQFEFHMISGNHEEAEGLLVLYAFSKFIDHIHVYLEPTIVDINGINFNFLPYPHDKGLKNHVNIAHIDMNGSRYDSGKVVKEKINPDSKIWVIGHNHGHQIVAPFCYYTGTLYQRKFGENNKKGYMTFTMAHHKRLQVVEADFHVLKQKYVMMTREVHERKDLELHSHTLKDDELYGPGIPILWRLLVAQGIAITPDYLLKHHVISWRYFTGAKHLQSLKNDDQVSFTDVQDFQAQAPLDLVYKHVQNNMKRVKPHIRGPMQALLEEILIERGLK